MKKTYFAPETVVIELKQNTCLLAGSDPVLGGGGGGEGNAPGMSDMPEMFDEPTLNTLLNQ